MAAGEITLQARMAEGPLSIAEAKRIASAIAEALENAHEKGLVHGDLNASDIVLTTEGQVRVLGLGPASDDNDLRTDILSLGEILREMIAGTPNVPELLAHVVRKMCAVRPENRYQLIHEVRTDLDHVPVEASPVPRPRSERSLPFGLGLGLVGALAVVAVLVVWMRPPPGTPSGGDLPAVAVLPLTNVSEDPLESDYLADGISRAVAIKLTQVGLRVTPWETARRYRDAGPAETVARELNVDAVLVGTFQVSEDEILTTLSLIEAENGFQTWADIIVEPYEDLFQLQIRIATAVASSLKDKLTGEEEQALAMPESRSVDAYDFYLQGSHSMQEGTEGATNIAFDYFTRAVELDPGLAEAHVGLGAVYSARYWFGWGGFGNVDSARLSNERALELDPENMRARRGLVLVNFYRGDAEACLIQGREAKRYGRADDLETVLTRAVAYHLGGMPDRSVPLFRQVIEIDPVHQEAHWHLVWAHRWSGQYEEAIGIGDAYLRRFGDDHEIHHNVAASYLLLGNPEGAREHYEKAMRIASVSSSPYPLLLGGLFLDRMGERERAEEVWRRAVDLAEPKLEAYPDLVEVRLLLAILHGLLGERDLLAKEEQRALRTVDHPLDLAGDLAAVHVRLGETERALELLRRSSLRGRGAWAQVFNLVLTAPFESQAFDRFLDEQEAEVQRLREMY